MTKTSEFLIGVAIAGAAVGAYYILTHNKKTEVKTVKEMLDDGLTCEELGKKLDFEISEAKEHISDIGEKVEDLMENTEDAIEDFVETAEVKVEEARDKVEEVTKDVVNRISRELAKANNYDIPPYEISHETYIQPMGEWKKVTVFCDGDKFHGIYGEEYKPFVLGQDNIDHFLNDELSVMYIRNENLECDYAVYKGEENGELV